MTESTPPSTPTETAESSGVAVLDRAFSLLAAFGPDDSRLTLTELSKRTGLYKSTVLRLLAALEHGGFIRKLQDGQYSIGPEPLRLASIYQRSFQVGHAIEPLLKQLSATTGETASFYVRHGDKRIALFRVEPARSVRASVQIGQEYAIAQGASGKVLLAFSLPVLPGYDAIREQLWAVSYGERDPETASAAAPVFGVTGELQGALAVSGPRERLTSPEAMLAACRHVLETARAATSALGGNTSRFPSSLERLSTDSLRNLSPGVTS
ncbi:helix-turn-helix domain-containing protein [Variovorax paradoxus]|uniref:Helix-turn-helix domain-containing protein n=1 Tax=Variovorax paradoxus TaxID=34073 RepID=A0A5Q0M7L0_VARPD|nr:IclR family transcriptional regulator [Variovorax paradoxus]QFZ85178.1 helix-turn-helix domain-containing protein [Variovorax paradoxus]